jgi:hypothetical protein
MNLQTSAHRAIPFPGAVGSIAHPAVFSQVVLKLLTTRAEIESVLHLREEIDLSVHAAAGPHFAALEKKEMSADSCSPSTWKGNA